MILRSGPQALASQARGRPGDLTVIAAVLSTSVLLGVVCGMGWWTALAAIGAVALFVVLVWDIRVVVPVLLFLMPLGPRFASSVGNIYLSTVTLALAYAAWIWRNALLERPYAFRRNPVVVALAVFLAVLVLSAIRNFSYLLAHSSDLLRLVQLMMYAAFFVLVLSMSFSRLAIRALLVAALAAGLLEAIVGLWLWPRDLGLFVHGTFEGGHSDFAVYAILIASLLLGVVLEARRTAVMAAGLGALAVVLVAIAFSYSRGGYTSLVAALLTFLVLPLRKGRRVRLGLALAVGAGLLAVVGPQLLRERFGDLASTVSLSRLPVSFVHRLGMWKQVLEDFSQNPLIGRGLWVYYLRDNYYMRVLGETGLVGLAAFAGLLVTILREERRAIRARVEDDLVRGLAVGLLPATVGCLLVFHLSGDFFVVHRFMGVFWVVLALVLKYCLGIGVTDGDRGRSAS